jgi:hypothetical protein
MTPSEKQRVFDAINSAIDTHAPKVPPERRIAIATDAALKIAGVSVDATPAPAARDR